MLKPEDVYSLVSLTAFYNGYFEQCSKAFTRLESMSQLTEVTAVCQLECWLDMHACMVDALTSAARPPMWLDSLSHLTKAAGVCHRVQWPV